MQRPLIGITCSRNVGGRWSSYSLGNFQDFVFDAYSRGVLVAGGAPLLIPITQNKQSISALCHSLDGLIFSGGPDINPRFYQHEPLPGLREVDDDSDRTAIELIGQALALDLPILCICRGIQLLNVALGGTLYQDVPTEIPSALNHNQQADRAVVTHTVTVLPDTLLRRIVKRDRLWVNSKHHQAVSDVAPGLIVSAHAADGLVEAVEKPDQRFVVAVQWHPEGLWPHDIYAKRLFQALIRAAASRDGS
jgi:putative glutamine amidotransferase